MRVLALVLLAVAIPAADLPQAVAATDPRLAYSGRWDLSEARGPRGQWPGSQVRLAGAITAANVVLAGPKDQAIQVVVDGVATTVITLEAGRTVYPVAEALPVGAHEIALFKRSEGWGGAIQVRGFQLDAGATLAVPVAARRRIEFIGDSISAGYGNESANAQERFSLATENAWLAWPALTARAFGAELSLTAISGSTLQDLPKRVCMPTMWRKTLYIVEDKAWDFARWTPDAVVVNLGTNDARGGMPTREAWHESYRRFIAGIRDVYPQAHLFLASGPMLRATGVLDGYNRELVAACAQQGDARVHALLFADQDAARDGIGADGHPSLKTHARMAEVMTAAIRQELGW